MSLPRAAAVLALALAACGSASDSVKHADTATRATTADSADQVNWAGVQGKPSWVLTAPPTYAAGTGLTLTGTTFSLAPSTRTGRAYYPASALATTSTFTRTSFGVVMPAAGTGKLTWIGPRPVDWLASDSTRPFKVTIHFLVPSVGSAGDMSWRMTVAGAETDLTGGNANTGWDSPYYVVTTDAPLTTYAADSGHGEILKSQTFTATWSSTYGGWTFPPSGVSTANIFRASNNPIWQFGFQRGNGVGNGETNTADFTVIGVSIEYPVAP